MDPSSAHHHQEMANETLESMLVCTKTQQPSSSDQKKPRPQPEHALKCPRCDSANTKFCYYNNYSLTQPRYFCKSCRRYWTKGGTLRNVPVGGGCRKNKRSSSSSSKRSQLDQALTPNIPSPLSSSSTLPPLTYDYSSDLSLAFAGLHHRQQAGQLGFDDHHDFSVLGNHNINLTDFLGNPNVSSVQSSHTTPSAFLEAIRGGLVDSQNGFHQNLNYGVMGINGNYNMGSLENEGEMGMPCDHHEDHVTSGATTTAVTVTTMKQEMCSGREGGDQGRAFWGFPWQIGGEGINNVGDLDAVRESWNGIGSSWHNGLLNSPLM